MTPHFTDAELTCKCGCGMLPDPEFMNQVETLRVIYGQPMTVTSAARCPAYNSKVSGTGTSGPHTTGKAIDIAVRGEDAVRFLHLALDLGFTGIGVAQKGASRFIHIDSIVSTNRPMIWSY